MQEEVLFRGLLLRLPTEQHTADNTAATGGGGRAGSSVVGGPEEPELLSTLGSETRETAITRQPQPQPPQITAICPVMGAPNESMVPPDQIRPDHTTLTCCGAHCWYASAPLALPLLLSLPLWVCVCVCVRAIGGHSLTVIAGACMHAARQARARASHRAGRTPGSLGAVCAVSPGRNPHLGCLSRPTLPDASGYPGSCLHVNSSCHAVAVAWNHLTLAVGVGMVRVGLLK
jgi:hypothetical protein